MVKKFSPHNLNADQLKFDPYSTESALTSLIHPITRLPKNLYLVTFEDDIQVVMTRKPPNKYLFAVGKCGMAVAMTRKGKAVLYYGYPMLEACYG